MAEKEEKSKEKAFWRAFAERWRYDVCCCFSWHFFLLQVEIIWLVKKNVVKKRETLIILAIIFGE